MPTGFNSTSRSVSGNGAIHALNTVRYIIADGYGTAIGHGDPVAIDATSGALVRAAATDVVVGVLRGIQFINADGELKFNDWFPAGTTNTGSIDGTTDVVAIVEPAADHVFAIDTSASIAQSDIGDNKLVTMGTVNTSTGRSGAVVDMAGSVTTEKRVVQILDIQRTPGNAFGAVAVALVRFV